MEKEKNKKTTVLVFYDLESVFNAKNSFMA